MKTYKEIVNENSLNEKVSIPNVKEVKNKIDIFLSFILILPFKVHQLQFYTCKQNLFKKEQIIIIN